MKVVFFGTPEYVLPVLKAIHKKFVAGPGKSPIVAVVTQSPKPTGRKQIMSYSPVDKWAHEHKLSIFYSANDLLNENLEFEVGVLASYGEIIKKEVIDLFPKGILVIHPSLLPTYRGASPVSEAIKNGDQITGVSIIRMDEKMDHGPIVAQSKEEILDTDTNDSLRARLFDKSKDLLLETIEPYLKGRIKSKTQNHEGASFTKILKKEDGYVDPEKDDPNEVERKSRAYYPWPGIFTKLPDGKRLKILKSHVEGGKLVLDEVQIEGKNPVKWKQFVEAYPLYRLS